MRMMLCVQNVDWHMQMMVIRMAFEYVVMLAIACLIYSAQPFEKSKKYLTPVFVKNVRTNCGFVLIIIDQFSSSKHYF